MTYKRPADIAALSGDDLTSALTAATDEYQRLAAIADDVITDEELVELEQAGDDVTALQTREGEVQAEAQARLDRIAAAKAKVVEPEAGGDEDPAADPEVETEVETDPEADPEAEPEPAGDLVAAGAPVAAARGGVARRAASKAVAPKPPVKPIGSVRMAAGADVPGTPTGKVVDSLDEVAKLFDARVGGFPKFKKGASVSNRYGVTAFEKVVPDDYHLVDGDIKGNMSKIFAASARGVQAVKNKDALVAAGGWCSPSQYVYDLCALEKVAGILDIPEVVFDRGGIQFTKGPDFADIYTDSGFLQTETEAEAGTEKNFIDVECPAFEEVRMDAIGFGVRAGILTNRTYPELVRRYLEGVLVAHAHKVNAYVINKIATAAGAAINLTEYGSAYSDTLQGLEMQATRLRYKYRLDENDLIEGAAPIWFKAVLRADISYRNSVVWQSVTDEQINAELRLRNISLQWVFDYQDLTATGLTWPNTVDILLWTPGAFVKGTLDVISMDAVYDTDGLAHNTYTAAFFEEGVSVFNPCGNAVKVQLTLGAAGDQAEIKGSLGFPKINAPAFV